MHVILLFTAQIDVTIELLAMLEMKEGRIRRTCEKNIKVDDRMEKGKDATKEEKSKRGQDHWWALACDCIPSTGEKRLSETLSSLPELSDCSSSLGRPRRVTSPHTPVFILCNRQTWSPSGLPKPAFWFQAFFLSLVASSTPPAGSWAIPTTSNYHLLTTAASDGGSEHDGSLLTGAAAIRSPFTFTACLGFPGLSGSFLQHLF